MNSTPKNTPNAEICELTDAELDAVTGGLTSQYVDQRFAEIGAEARAFYDQWLSTYHRGPEFQYQ